MTLIRDLSPTGAPLDLLSLWTTGAYTASRASSRFVVALQQAPGPLEFNHTYGFGKQGTETARGPVISGTQCWAANSYPELSWSTFAADQVTTVAIALRDFTPITSFTIYPKRINVSPTIVGGSLVLQVPIDTRLLVEVNGDRTNPLCIYSDPLEVDTEPTATQTYIVNSGAQLSGLEAAMNANHPDNASPGSTLKVVFAPGIWKLPTLANTQANANGNPNKPREFDGMLSPVRRRTKIHFKRGAWVIGSWDIRDCDNVDVSGPGTLSGEWVTYAQMLNVVQGAANQYINAGQALSFSQQVTFAMWYGGDDGDFDWPAMTARNFVQVGSPFYNFERGFNSYTRLKVKSPWLYNCDCFGGLMLDPATTPNSRSASKCFGFAGDDGLFLADNYKTTISDSHIICTNGSPIMLGYWPTQQVSTGSLLVQNVTAQQVGPQAVFGRDLNTGVGELNWNSTQWGPASSEAGWTQYGPYSAPTSLTNAIVKCWIDGDEVLPPWLVSWSAGLGDIKTWGRYNVTIDGLYVDGAMPTALFSIENCYYPFGSAGPLFEDPASLAANKAGNVANWTIKNVVCETLPQHRSRLIGRDRKNTPHDITFENVVIAGKKLTSWNWDDYVLMDSSPYNIFVEGRLVVTALDVCNTALSQIGESTVVTSISPSDGSAQADLCQRFYNPAVEELLMMHSWSFATKRTTLTENATSDVDEWAHSYQVPADLGRVLQVLGPDTPDDVIDSATREPPAHTIEQSSTGDLALYTNVEDAVLRYATFVYDANKYPSLFVSSLGWLLASKLAGALIKGDQGASEAKRCLQMAQWYVAKAAALDGTQRNKKPTHSVPWISQR